MRRTLLAAPLVAAVLVAGCRDLARPVAPPAAALGPATPSALVASDPGAATAAALVGDVRAATGDARDRVVPTLAEGAARATLDAALGNLDAALGAGDPLQLVGALEQATAALDAVRSAGFDAPAELSAVELALDRASALVAPIATPVAS